MQIRSVLFGLGLGLVLLSAAVLFVYRYETRQFVQTSDEAIIARATEMGMIWPTEDVAEVVRKAFELGMVFEGEEDADAP